MTVPQVRETRVTTEGCGARALCGWSPQSLPADTEWKRRVDTIRLGTVAAVGVLVVVVGLLNVAGNVSPRPALAVYGVTGLIAGGWCALNFWRCRHAHCLITGPGWMAFGLFALAEALLGHSVISRHEYPVFMAILAIAVIFELGWYSTRHTNAVRFRPASYEAEDDENRS